MLRHCLQKAIQSTSLASTGRAIGTVRPSALAVLNLISKLLRGRRLHVVATDLLDYGDLEISSAIFFLIVITG
jgi:hypothetical protein